MRIDTTTEYVAEVGDKVLIISKNKVGIIKSFSRHCSACEPYANVCIDDGEISDCPDRVDLQWDGSKGMWIYNE